LADHKYRYENRIGAFIPAFLDSSDEYDNDYYDDSDDLDSNEKSKFEQILLPNQFKVIYFLYIFIY